MRLSPLFGTAMVLVVLGLLAIPLQRLTGSERGRLPSAVAEATQTPTTTTPALARLRLLREARSVELRSDEGQLLWKAENLPAGETEAEIQVEIIHDEAVLHLRAEFPDDGTDTAVFVSVFPDGLEERSAHAIGGASFEERLVFTWPHHGQLP